MAYKTWVEIRKNAVAHNIRTFRSVLRPKTKLWSVVKSNAYGHGLVDFSMVAEKQGVDGFCVDSVAEGLTMRKNGITKPILVLGPTLFPELLIDAHKHNITVTASSFHALANLARLKNPPLFHLKIDTGMRRQGFRPSELTKVLKEIRNSKFEIRNFLKGAYTHFASAKDLNYPTYTNAQWDQFRNATKLIARNSKKKLTFHAAATGGTLMNRKYHGDAVRVGIGLYGLWPSKELMMQRPDISLRPALSWHAVVSEVKMLTKGDFVGYDLVERVDRSTKVALIPIGYWHGFPRALSAGTGEVLIRGKRAKVLGRVSMDLLIVNATNIPCRVGDMVTLIGRQKKEDILAFDIAQKTGTIHYELITRINPLIKRIVV